MEWCVYEHLSVLYEVFVCEQTLVCPDIYLHYWISHIYITFYLPHPVAVFMKIHGTCSESCNICHQEFRTGYFSLPTH